jgi:hypothetical protein
MPGLSLWSLRSFVCGAGLLAAIALPSPVRAQATDPRPPTRVIGEEYHIEAGGGIWRPSLFGVISSEQFGIVGSDIDFITDLGFKQKQFLDGRLVLRPAKKHKFRVQYTPVTYSADSTLARDVVFNGIRYPRTVPVRSTYDWIVWRFGYEYDFIYKDRWFLGFLMEGRYTQMKAHLKSVQNDESTSAKAPLPAFGLVGRVYPIRNLSITAEVSGFKLPKLTDYEASYGDIDIYGTFNFTRYLGIQMGWRRMTSDLRVKTDTGNLRFQGIWFGGALRY